MEWHKLLWGSSTVPKYSFIAWMAVLDRLSTKDRMQSWGIVVDRQCVLVSRRMKPETICFSDVDSHKVYGKGYCN